MAFESDKLGPGQLTIGLLTNARTFGGAMKSGKVAVDVEKSEILTVLDGSTATDGGGETAKFEGECYQEYTMTSLLAWSKDQAGVVHPFSYRARSDRALSVAGRVEVHSLDYGGDVKERATSKFEFPLLEWWYYDATVAPTASSALPASAATGAVVTITGTNLGGVTKVTVGGTEASFRIVSKTSIEVTMPAGAAGSAPIVVSGWSGAASSLTYTRG